MDCSGTDGSETHLVKPHDQLMYGGCSQVASVQDFARIYSISPGIQPVMRPVPYRQPECVQRGLNVLHISVGDMTYSAP